MSTPLQHVLCVDDEDDILEIVQLCLSEVGGLNVTCLSYGELAVQRLNTIHPDLILIDMMMPKLNGLDAARLIRQEKGFQTIPIILMTARVQPSEVTTYLASGITAVIAKPFDPMTLSEQIHTIWNDVHGPK